MGTDKRITRRTYLLGELLYRGTDMLTALEAVSTTALAHPEWDMDEFRTWEEWEDSA